MTTIDSSEKITVAKPAIRFRQVEQNVYFNAGDAHGFNRVYREAPIVEETIGRVAETGKMENRVATSYQFDAHNELFKHNPRSSGMGDQFVGELMRRVRESKDYQTLRAATIGDDVAASLGACSLTERTIQELSEELKEQARKSREAKDEADAAREEAEAVSEDPDATPEEIAESAQAAADAAKAAKAQAAALAMAMKQHGKQIASAVAKAVSTATDSAQAAKDAQQCFGFGTGVGDPSGGLPIDEKFKLARTIQKAGPAFRKFAEILGRMTRTALQKQASKTQHEAGEIVDITTGSDIERIMDDEVALLANPKLAKLFRVGFASETLMQHEVDQREPQAKGDVVVLIDESGSMAGQREAEAKGVALALAHVCAKQKRRLVIHFFQSAVTMTVQINPGDAQATENGVNVALRKLGQIAGRGTAGGTSFDAPLVQAIATVRGGGLEKADVLMITDGCCDVADSTIKKVNALREETGAKVYSMLIGSSSGTETATLAKFSDKVWNADSLLGKVAEEFFELV